MESTIGGQRNQMNSATCKKIVSAVAKNDGKANTGNSAVASTLHFYQPFILEYTLMSEYKQLQNQNLPGIYVMPSAKSPLRWFGVMFIRQGLYQDGIFKFILHIPETYPECDTPSIVFQPTIYHPLINYTSGEMDIKRSFPNWRRNKHQLWHVLQYARRAFYKIDSSLPVNPEASVLFESNIELYKKKVADSIEECKEKLYESQDPDDPHAITFSKWEPSVHNEFMRKIKSQVQRNKEVENGKNAQTSGLSWVKSNSATIFSKPVS